MCEVHGDAFNKDWLEGVENSTNANTPDASSSQSESGESIRQAFTSYFQQNSL